MTAMEIAKKYDLLPKDVIAYIQNNATFPVKRNFQTGELRIPDNVDVEAFMAPLIDKMHAGEREKMRQAEEARQQEELRQAEQKRLENKIALEEKLLRESLDRQAAEQQNAVDLEALKKRGAEGYYQYKVISVMDANNMFYGNSGRVNTEAMTQTLNKLGMDGWRLVTAYTNELGKQSRSIGVGGFTSGTNATVDENVLIFERYVKF